MTAKIRIGNAEISLEIDELGPALKQLEPYLGLPPLVEPIRTPSLGRPIAQVAAEMALRALPASAPERESSRIKAVALLKLLADHQLSGGARSEEVQRVLGAAHVKGIGSKITPINAFLQVLGFNAQEVYRNDRDESGNRMWVPAARFQEAQDALKKESADELADLL